ncbi:MAG: FAD-binding oxidoreductase [Dehalococcoidales bacterium]|jgi:FAD/FMN-containing dehydrogenase
MPETELANITGSENVTDDAEALGNYAKDFSFVPRIRPSYIVKVNKADKVQELIKWANKTRTPLVPVSSGPPHFRGGTVPGSGGAVIADLSGMKQIMRTDRRNRVAMIEAGVTFSELIPELAKVGLRLNPPLLPRQSKSVIGSALDREPVIMPLYQWDAIDPLSCIEVVFGSGDLFRTGSAAGPGTLEQQWASKQAQSSPMGPGQTDFARVVQGSQGTMGIVTWATVRCEAIPTLQKPFLAGANKLENLTDFIYRLLWLKLGDEILILNNTDLAAILATTPAEYSAIRDSLPQWLLFFCLSGFEYFPEERVKYQEKEMGEAARQFGVAPVNAIAGISAHELLKTLARPSEEPYWKLRYKGACQDIFFLTAMNRAPGFVSIMHDLARQHGYSSLDIGTYIQPMVQGTSCHCEFNLFYDPNNASEVSRVRELYTHAGEAFLNNGAFFSRPYGTMADLVYRRDAETYTALRKVKSIFDPNNIMNPGKLCF